MPTLSHNQKGVIKLGLSDPLPEILVHQLFTLEEAPTYEVEPPAKRVKQLDSNVVSSCSFTAELLFNRPCSAAHIVARSGYFTKIAGKLSIAYDGDSLLLSAAAKSPTGPLNYSISLTQEEVSDIQKRVLALPRRDSPYYAERPGHMSTEVDLAMQVFDGRISFQFYFRVYWSHVSSPYQAFPRLPELKRSQEITRLLSASQNPFAPALTPSWTAMDFYDAAYVPPSDDVALASIGIPGLEADLFPYQKRSLKWLLKREGVEWCQESDSILEPPAPVSEVTKSFFDPVVDTSGSQIFRSSALAIITDNIAAFQHAEAAVRGGILAEEMGLGKTLEIIALILLHKRSTSPMAAPFRSEAVLASNTTLIVTPEPLRQQWLNEFARHAPSLAIVDYKGCKQSEDSGLKAVHHLASQDVVITTYKVLSAELHFAMEPPARSRRLERRYERPTSPLMKIGWWRLCLDEAQMIENGFSQAARVAQVLPRVNAWGITGTPIKDDIDDLYGLLSFLQYAPFQHNRQVWKALLSSQKDHFQKLFGSIALRHTKASVRDELKLPTQKRFVISVPFTAVEEQHYQSMYRQMREECGLDQYGGPLSDEWTNEDHEEDMRLWLNRLRQTVLHPEVGAQNRRALGRNRAQPLRTVDEVLDAMLDQSEAAIRVDERALLLAQLTRGQLFENGPRVREALELWKGVRQDVRKLVEETRVRLSQEIATNDDTAVDGGHNEPDAKSALGETRRRLRLYLELLHKAVFFCANAHYQIRENTSMTDPETDRFEELKKLENDEYEEAKFLRREILQDSHQRATRAMSNMSQTASDQAFVVIPNLQVLPRKGIETRRIVDELEELCGRLNEQANALDDWREHVVQLLLKPLLDEEDETELTGEELGDSAKMQDDLMAYVAALRAAIADRSDAITGQVNLLAKDEVRRAMNLAREGEGPAPELLIQLLNTRNGINPRIDNLSMRSIISDLRALMTRLSHDNEGARNAEYEIARQQLEATQSFVNKQNKASQALESEIEDFRAAMNARLEFYRQLQAVSDSVLPYDGPKDESTLTDMERKEHDLTNKLSQMRAKHRYLINLKEAGTRSLEPRTCVICQTAFTTGVLTVCGHQFCKACMMMWFKQRRNCPTCKKPLTMSSLHDIAVKPQALKLHDSHTSSREPSQSAADFSPQPKRRGAVGQKGRIYTEFNTDRLAEIRSIELDGPSFTTKVDALLQHLLWLRESDPGAKSIIFSQYKDFLRVLRTAFGRYKIGHSSIDDPKGITKFREDPSVEAFLLHARAHSSGLNLVNANHVFLCEPLLNTAIELQAIARVDRIGQLHETTVWLYIVSGTVEESIHELSVRRRMQHMTSNDKGKSRAATLEVLDASLEQANTLEMEHAALSKLMSKDKAAGEMVDRGDLWECLFGHVESTMRARREVDASDTRHQEQAVIGYLAAEAAERRSQK